jgi:FHA domain
MVKCPFCGFANEDGALFCEQCKSDLSSVQPVPPPPPPPPPFVPVAEVIEVPAADIIEVTPVAESPPMAHVMAEPAAPPMAIPDPLPLPLPAMAPPLEPEAIATHDAAAAAAAPAPAAPAGGAKAASIPPGSKPKLVVKRGQKIGFEFPIYPDANYVGRSDDKPVDIDLEDQEPPERVWCSRQHALIQFDETAGTITVEDLNSSNGTYVNRERVYPGQPRQLFVNDTIQIGTVHLALKV